ncbi:hypothetical protein QBC47DRAFT_225438 [Echria macrotheca]|uniref:Uncharacterized protein n=1 Tax=Echria macrotheca TaxID=438768 RepID=A0AAJ0BAM0_9PEZI|nr:hypothetical protein QBC47DRAFT_225438 [Echria macrotheca]
MNYIGTKTPLGRVAITGATGGIGSAIARRFAQDSASSSSSSSILLLGRNQAKLAVTLQQTQQHVLLHSSTDHSTNTTPTPFHPPKLESHVLDVTDINSWKTVAKTFPDIEILINVAGLEQTNLLIRTPPDQADAILQANLHGAVYGCIEVGRQMVKSRRGRGCIINVSSLLARKGTTGAAVYAAAKAGLIGLTTSLAVEMSQRGIRVNAVLPGYISTRMTKDLEKDVGLVSKIPAQRFGTPEEVADAVMFLAKNEYANNCILNLDGGLSAI